MPSIQPVPTSTDSDSESDTWADARSDVAELKEPPAEYPFGRPPDRFPDAELRDMLLKAENLKLDANHSFRASEWDSALSTYQRALRILPKRYTTDPTMKSVPLPDADDDSDPTPEGGDGLPEVSDMTGPSNPTLPPESVELDEQCAKARAVLNANIAACHVKLNNANQVVESCTEALADDPDYVKALTRRAHSNELLNTWTSLTAAQKDYERLKTLLPPSDPATPQVIRALQTLPSRIQVVQKNETDEMLSKLKDLGNSFLGNFGLSTDNFKMTPNGQGGYSMNFSQ